MQTKHLSDTRPVVSSLLYIIYLQRLNLKSYFKDITKYTLQIFGFVREMENRYQRPLRTKYTMSRHQQNLKRAAILAQENLMQKWMKLPEILSQYRLKLNLSRRDNAKYYIFKFNSGKYILSEHFNFRLQWMAWRWCCLFWESLLGCIVLICPKMLCKNFNYYETYCYFKWLLFL